MENDEGTIFSIDKKGDNYTLIICCGEEYKEFTFEGKLEQDIGDNIRFSHKATRIAEIKKID